MGLIDTLRSKLSGEDLALLRAVAHGPGEENYEAVIRRVASQFKEDEKQFWSARFKLGQYSDLLALPNGRRLTILRNCSPVLLLILFRDLIEKSYGDRFLELERSREVALVALEAAKAIAASEYLSPADAADLLAEAHLYLANAKRVNSDIAGADRDFQDAAALLKKGTGDRGLKADFLSFLAHLRVAQGHCTEAADLIEREIPLRRLLGDEVKLGFALVQRGWIGCLCGETDTELTNYFVAGLSRVPEDHQLAVQALHALAEHSAREGRVSTAWRMLVSAETPLQAVEGERFQLQHRWITGLAHRAAHEMRQAAQVLSEVRSQFLESGPTHQFALVSLDLACVYAAQGKLEEVKQLTEEAHAVFKAEGLEEQALTALVVLREAIETERVTEGMAVAVVNFLARFPFNKALRFEWKSE